MEWIKVENAKLNMQGNISDTVLLTVEYVFLKPKYREVIAAYYRDDLNLWFSIKTSKRLEFVTPIAYQELPEPFEK